MKPLQVPLINLLSIESDQKIQTELVCELNKTAINIHVVEVQSLVDAKNSLTSQQYDCILLNYKLYKTNEICVLKAFQKTQNKVCPVVMVIDNDDVQLSDDIVEFTIIDFIATEDCNNVVLENVISDVLARRQWDDSLLNGLVNKRQITQAQLTCQSRRKSRCKVQSLEQSLFESQRLLVEKSQLILTMGHELKTPLNAVVGYAQLLQQSPQSDGKHPLYTREIISAGKYLTHLIDETLLFSKIESGHLKVTIGQTALNELIGECLNLLEHQASQHNIVLNHNELAKTMVNVDHIKLRQVLVNLLSNAIKYNKAGGMVRIEVIMVAPDNLKISVSDTGHGIAAEDFDKLFEPFNRLGYCNSDVEGTGIGLSITKRLVELMGGTIEVRSEVGLGSTFIVQLSC